MLARGLKQAVPAARRGLNIARSGREFSVAPVGWAGPRGNFLPAAWQDDPFRAQATCTETLFTEAPGLINLDTGAPCSYLLNRAQACFAEGTVAWAARGRSNLNLQYGPVSGTLDFRTQLAGFLAQQYGEVVEPSGLFQTSGATQGLAHVLSAFFGRSRRKVAFVEDPTYFLAPKIFEEHGFEVVPVAHQHLGEQRGALDLDALEMEVSLANAAGALDDSSRFRGIVYCVPTYHNPTGTTMPAASRERLVAIARKYRLLVVTDDVYELLPYPGFDAPPRVLSYDLQGGQGGNVVSNGTFSKILGPGVRTGWIEAAPKLAEALADSSTVASSGAFSQLTGSIISELLRSGRQVELLEETRALYARRMRALQASFARHAPRGCSLTAPAGGMCAWLTMPEGTDSHAILRDARRRGVSFKPGDWFSPAAMPRGRNACRLVVAHYDEETLARGVELLCDVLAEHGAAREGASPFSDQFGISHLSAPVPFDGFRN